MIIPSRGIGIVIPLIVGGCYLFTAASFNLVAPAYFAEHQWPKLVAFVIAAVALFFIGRYRSHTYADFGRDSLFFIPMQLWAAIVLIGGFCFLFANPADTNAAAGTGPGATAPVHARSQSASAPANQSGSDLRLQAIFYNANGHSTAMISQQTVGVGEKVGNYTVVTIDPLSVTLQSARSNLLVLRTATR